jgi:hypothetical protein
MSRLAAVLALTFATTFTLVLIGVEPARAQAVQPANQTQRIVAVTNRFLKTLTPADRQKVQFAYADAQTATPATFKGGKDGRMAFVGEQYGQAVWSNYPTSDVPRPGLALGGMSTTQRAAAMQLLQAMLSPRGYQKVLEIMGSDDALTAQGNPFPTGAGTYTIGIFGTPDPAKPWMVQFGGHHLGLNLTIAGERGVLTPTLTGAQPAVYTAGGKTVRALAHENDKAFAFLAALDKGQREQAVLGYEVKDLVLGPGQSGKTIPPEGLKASSLSERQRALLVDLVGEWAGIVNAPYARSRMEEIRAGLDETYFAWSGPLAHEPGRNGSSYYRIQGPKVFIEFSPQGVGGDPTMHVHTMYRDPTNDYGTALKAAR